MNPPSFYMKSSLVILVVVSILQCLSAELIQVQMVVRHGARTPLAETYPTDPYKNNTYQPLGFGQLTMRGKRQALKFGRILRNRYDDLLGSDFYLFKQKLIASEMDRTEITALSIMAGLWPPTKDQTIISGLKWQPVPYVSRELIPGSVIGAKGVSMCTDPEFHQRLRATFNNSTLDYIKKYSGITNICFAVNVYTALEAQDAYNLELPAWTDAVYPDTLNTLTGVMMQRLFGDPFVRQLQCVILRDMVDSFDKTIAGAENATLLNMYVAHDLTVAQMQICLNVFRPHVPKYVANIAFELHQLDDGSFSIMIMYQEELDWEPEVLVIPGCDELCPYRIFKNAVLANFRYKPLGAYRTT